MNTERAITGLKGFYEILEPLLLAANYEGQGENDVKELKEDIALAVRALEEQKAIKSTYYGLKEIIARNIMAYETSKDKECGLEPEIQAVNRALFRKLTKLEPTKNNLEKFIR